MSNVTLGLVLIFLLATVMSLEDAGKWIGAAVWPLEALVDWISGLFSARKARPLKIRQLSPKEARRLSAWLARWQRLRGDATADHDHVEDAIAGLYDLRGSPGLRFRWVDSPGARRSAGMPPAEGAPDPIAGPR